MVAHLLFCRGPTGQLFVAQRRPQRLPRFFLLCRKNSAYIGSTVLLPSAEAIAEVPIYRGQISIRCAENPN